MTDANPVTTPMEAGISLSKFPAIPLTAQEELDLKAIPYRSAPARTVQRYFFALTLAAIPATAFLPVR